MTESMLCLKEVLEFLNQKEKDKEKLMMEDGKEVGPEAVKLVGQDEITELNFSLCLL